MNDSLASKRELVFIKITWRGTALHRGSKIASHPAAPDLIPSIPKKFRGKINVVAEVNLQCWLEESGLKMLVKPI